MARLTAPTVAAGAVARKWLKQQHGCEFIGWMSQLGPIAIEHEDEAQIPLNPFFAPNTIQLPQLEAYMDELRKDGDSCGAKLIVEASGMPVGLGDPLFAEYAPPGQRFGLKFIFVDEFGVGDYTLVYTNLLGGMQ